MIRPDNLLPWGKKFSYASREVNWKLILQTDNDLGTSTPFALYELVNDLEEQVNLIGNSTYANRVNSMTSNFDSLRSSGRTIPELILDIDSDGILDIADNCTTISNPLQADTDNDSHGDDCDAFPNDPGEYLDTDSDGICNNADPDDDNDGLTDTEEATSRTDPVLSDTDGDEFSDGIETINGTDPLNSDSYPTFADGDLAPLGAPDGKINAADVLVGMQISLGLLTPGSLQLSHGDVYPTNNPDGNIGLPDILLIMKNALGVNQQKTVRFSD